MTTKIDTIVEALRACIAAITVAGGYNNDMGDVSAEFVVSSNTAYPACMIVSGVASTFEDLPGDYCEALENINLYVIVKNPAAPLAALNSVRSDIFKAVSADPTLGGACIRLMILKSALAGDVVNVDGYPPGINQSHAYMRIECQALYEFLQTSGMI